jgi:hypothetical protein
MISKNVTPTKVLRSRIDETAEDKTISPIANESSIREAMTSGMFADDADESTFGGISKVAGVGYSPTDEIDTAVVPGSDSFVGSSQVKPHSVEGALEKVSDSLQSLSERTPSHVKNLSYKVRAPKKKHVNIETDDTEEEELAFMTPKITNPKEHMLRKAIQLKKQTQREMSEFAEKQPPLQKIKLKKPPKAEELEEESDEEKSSGDEVYTGKLPLTKGLINANKWRDFYFQMLKGKDKEIHNELSVKEIRKQCIPYALKLYKSLGGEKPKILKSKNPEQIYDAYLKLYGNVGKKLRSGNIYI